MAFETLSANDLEIATSAPIPNSLFPFVTCEPFLTTAQLPKLGGIMSNAIRTTLRLVASILLFNVLTTAQAGGNNADKDKNTEHHSRFAKVAFWRHHKDADTNAKQAQATKAPATQAPSKQAQGKQAQAKQAQVKTAQVKPASAKQ